MIRTTSIQAALVIIAKYGFCITITSFLLLPLQVQSYVEELDADFDEQSIMKRASETDITPEEEEITMIANTKVEGENSGPVTERFVAEFNQTSSEYEFIIELTNEYYCEKHGSFHVLCGLQENRTGMKYFERGVNDTEIDFITRFIVRLRKRLLHGKEDKGDPGPLPKAARLRVIRWNQELQVIAQRLSSQCKSTLNASIIMVTDSFSSLRVNFAVSKDTQNRPRWTQALMHWYGEVKRVKPDVIYRKSLNIDNYAAMIWANTGLVGCGYSACKGKEYGIRIKFYVCVFAPAGNKEGVKMYYTDKSEYEIPTTTTTTTTEKPKIAITTKKPGRKNPFKKVSIKEEWDTS